jgi:hypothetical protein
VKFAVADLFLVGTALDLVGGVLIAKGLLISLPVLAARAATLFGGNPAVAVGAVEDRVDARFGLFTLGAGFVLQASGYFVTLTDEPIIGGSTARALTALGMALTAIVVVLIAWRVARDRMIRRDLIHLACLEKKGGPTVHSLPDLAKLAAYGRAWKGPQSKGDGERAEIDRDDVRLIFGDVQTRRPPEPPGGT